MKTHIWSDPRDLVWQLHNRLAPIPAHVVLENTPPPAAADPSDRTTSVPADRREVLLIDPSAAGNLRERLEAAAAWRSGGAPSDPGRLVVLLVPPGDSAFEEAFALRFRPPFQVTPTEHVPTGDLHVWLNELLEYIQHPPSGPASNALPGSDPASSQTGSSVSVVVPELAVPAIPTPQPETVATTVETPPATTVEAIAEATCGTVPDTTATTVAPVEVPPPLPESSGGPGWTCRPMRVLYGIGDTSQGVTASRPPVDKQTEIDFSRLLVQLFRAEKVSEGCTVVGFTGDARLMVIRVLDPSQLPNRLTLNAVAWILPRELPMLLRCRPAPIIELLRDEVRAIAGAMPSEAALQAPVRFPLEVPTATEINGAVERLLALPREHLGALFHRLVAKQERMAWTSADTEPDRLRFIDDLHLVLPPACWNGVTWTTDYHKTSPLSAYLGVLHERRRPETSGCCQIHAGTPEAQLPNRSASADATRQLQAYLTTPGLAPALALLWKRALTESARGVMPNAWNEWRLAALELACLIACQSRTPEELVSAIRSTNCLTQAVLCAEPGILDTAWEQLWLSATSLEQRVVWLQSSPASTLPATTDALRARIEEDYLNTRSNEVRRAFLQLWEHRGLPVEFVASMKARERQRVREALTTAKLWIEWLAKATQNAIAEITRQDHARLAVALRREKHMTERVKLVDEARKLGDGLLQEHLQVLQDTYRDFADVPTLAAMFRLPNVHLKDLEDPVTRTFIHLFEREQEIEVQWATLILIRRNPQLEPLYQHLLDRYNARQASATPNSKASRSAWFGLGR